MMNAVENGVTAVSRLMQLIAPAPEWLEDDAVLEAVQEAYDHDLPLMWAVYHLGKHEAVFATEWTDVFTLVEQLRAVAANWRQRRNCAVMVSRCGVGRATILICVSALSAARKTRICCGHARRRWRHG